MKNFAIMLLIAATINLFIWGEALCFEGAVCIWIANILALVLYMSNTNKKETK